jgi:hypothetical protein
MESIMPGLILGGLASLILIHLFIIILRGELEAKKLFKGLIRDKLHSGMCLSVHEKIELKGNRIFFTKKNTEATGPEEIEVLEMIELVKFSRLGWHIKISPWLHAKNSSLFEYFEKFV